MAEEEGEGKKTPKWLEDLSKRKTYVSDKLFEAATKLAISSASQEFNGREDARKETKERVLEQFVETIASAKEEKNLMLLPQVNEAAAKMSRDLGHGKEEWMQYLGEAVIGYRQLANIANTNKDKKTASIFEKHAEELLKRFGVRSDEIKFTKPSKVAR